MSASNSVSRKDSDDTTQANDTPHPIDAASCFSLFIWAYMHPLLSLGLEKRLDKSDMPSVPREHASDEVLRRFRFTQRRLAREAKSLGASSSSLEKDQNELIPAMIVMFHERWIYAGLLYFLWCVSAASQPFLVKRFVAFLKDEDAADSEGYILGCLIFVGSVVYNLSISHKFQHLVRNGSSVQSLLKSLVLQKLLRLPLTSPTSSSIASNLVGTDVERVFEMQLFLHYLWASPLFVFTMVALLVQEIGVAAIVGMALLAVVIPLQARLGRRVGADKRALLAASDKRMEAIKQLLDGIHVLKAYSTEEQSFKRITELREVELQSVWRVQVLRAVMRVILFVSPSAVAFATLAVYVGLGNDLELGVALLVMSYINILRFPLLLIPHAFATFAEGKTSLDRIERFLNLEERTVEKHAGVVDADQQDALFTNRGGLDMKNVSFGWARGSISMMALPLLTSTTPDRFDSFSVRDCTLMAEPGSLIGVVGRVGAGKSTFLLGLLGELPLVRSDGSTAPPTVQRRVAYMGHSPSIFNGTIQENVLFGLPMVPALYEKALDAACLKTDLFMMPAGDQAEIGEDGVNLSGGQKARVGLARVFYAALASRDCPADEAIVAALLDDPLSALDAVVAERVFREGILGVLKDITCVLVVSSHMALLRAAQQIAVFDDGRMTEVGNFDKVVLPILESLDSHKSESEASAAHGTVTRIDESGSAASITVEMNEHKQHVTKRLNASDGTVVARKAAPTLEAMEQSKMLVQEEDRETGVVDIRVYRTFFDQMELKAEPEVPTDGSGAESGNGNGSFWLSAMLIFYAVGQIVRVMTDVWLSWWFESGTGSSPVGDRSQTYWFATATVWLASNLGIALARNIFCVSSALRVSRNLHTAALKRLLEAPLLYFQQNPKGRILNRFSGDFARLDLQLPETMFSFLDNAFILASAFVLLLVSSPWMILLTIPVMAAFWAIQNVYRSSSRELLRLDASSKSPLFSWIGQVFLDRATVRAFGQQAFFERRAVSLSDDHSRVFVTVRFLERWISFYVNLTVAVAGATLMIMAVATRSVVDPAVVGLAVVYSLQMMGLSSWTMRMFVNLENFMTSVERVRHMLHLPREGQLVPPISLEAALRHAKTEDERLDPSLWPSQGVLSFHDVHLRYRPDLPSALRGVTASFRAGERVGICGRTGAGKSSIAMALFRLFEPQAGSRILLDGVDVMSLPLSYRNRIGFVPQDPVVFAGTVRNNLDPFATYSDDELWRVLEKVQLAEYVRGFRDGLLHNLSGVTRREKEPDSNMKLSISVRGVSNSATHDEDIAKGLSHGQRQLLCIARVLLKQCRVLLCDEATSSVDPFTDGLIQHILRAEFKNSTVLTIAHRLETIMDSDRVLVMSDGAVAEFDSPQNLMASTDQDGVQTSLFAQLVASQRAIADQTSVA